MHKQVLDKPDKAFIDSNFLVLQNEMDNLNVKLKFHEHKNTQLEDTLTTMLSTELTHHVALLKENLKTEGLYQA